MPDEVLERQADTIAAYRGACSKMTAIRGALDLDHHHVSLVVDAEQVDAPASVGESADLLDQDVRPGAQPPLQHWPTPATPAQHSTRFSNGGSPRSAKQLQNCGSARIVDGQARSDGARARHRWVG